MTEQNPAPEPASTEPAAAAPTTEQAPWGDDFNAEKAWSTIQNLRQDLKAAKADRTPQDEKDAKTIAALKRQLESTPSPEDVKKEFAQAIGKALGLVEDEPVDPVKLTDSLATSQAEAKQARVELAIFRAANAAGGDPAALLDSSSFLKSLDSIDPSDSAAVTEAIAKAVEANPRLGAAPAAIKMPAPNPAQGVNNGTPPSPEALAAQAAKQGDWKASSAHKAEQLLALREQTR